MERSSDQTPRDSAHFLEEYGQLLQIWQQQQTDFDNRLALIIEQLQARYAQIAAHSHPAAC